MSANAGEVKPAVENVVNEFAARGFRSLGVARADPERKWRFIGVLPLFEPFREQARATIASTRQIGVGVKMVTGDQTAIARETARQLGMGSYILDAGGLGLRGLAAGADPPTAGCLVPNLLWPCLREKTMLNLKTLGLGSALLALLAAGISVGCSRTSTKSPDVSASVGTALDRAGFKDVSVSQDRDKGVVNLGGHVATDGDKSQAESVARSIAGDQVVSNQIAVIPLGAESDARRMNADLDKGIESNLDAALVNEKLRETVKYTVKNHVVTLTGEVDSQAKRARVQQVASAVPNVQQVVNELQVKDQKASSSN
jgi:osmotically-inducible protein OsmY